MHVQRPDPFPCPFCNCGSLLLIGGNRRFQYYRCGACAEVWTVTEVTTDRRDARPEARIWMH